MSRDFERDDRSSRGLANLTTPRVARETAVAVLTGSAHRPYAFGVAPGLISRRVTLDVIGKDEMDYPVFQGKPGVTPQITDSRSWPNSCIFPSSS